MSKRAATIRVLMALIVALMLFGVGRWFLERDNFNCMTTATMGVCYWYHGK